MRFRPSAALLTAVLALLAAAQPVFAANITSGPDPVASLIDYTAGAGETNDVTVTRSGNTLTFMEAAAPLTESSPACTQPGGADTPVICTIEATGTYVVVTLLDLVDELTATGVAGVYFDVTGGNGVDTLRGGDGGNQLAGNADGDNLTGGADDDTFQGGSDADTMTGGGQDTDPGTCGDRADYSEKSNNLAITLDDQANDDTGDGDVLSGVESITGGSGDDVITGTAARNCLNGRDGGDVLTGLGGDDLLQGSGGGDTLDGGDGDDDFDDETTGDEVAIQIGGAGVDSAYLCAYTAGPVIEERDMTITLDGIANDGPDANDNIDAEDLDTCDADDTLFGSADFNALDSGLGNDTIDAGLGSDVVDAGGGDDTVEARDGFSDRVDCADGTDTARVDQLDTVRNCETVVREDRAVALDVPEDRPPAVEFTAPGAGATIAANAPTTLRANAADDRGIARVLFVDDDRVVCSDTAPPYDCAYQPRAEDVNRNTLAVVAVDTAEQAAFANRTVSVPRFTATRLRATTTPRRDRRRPFRFTTRGRLELPPVVAPALACKGRITIQVKTGGNTISTRRTNLTRRCTYRSRVTFRVPRRLVRRRLKVTVRFGGNAVVAARRARSYFIRTA